MAGISREWEELGSEWGGVEVLLFLPMHYHILRTLYASSILSALRIGSCISSA